MTTAMRTSVFLCYSHHDGNFRNDLISVLKPCGDAIDLWSDRAIPPGVEWEPEIDHALSRADAAVIVVSPSLLASEFVTNRELPKILKRHRRDGMRPMWIHYRPAMYERSAISKFQALHDPKTALLSLTKPKRDEAVLAIARRICEQAPERSLANVLRAADQVFIGETKSQPGVKARMGPTGITMVMGGKQTLPFVKYDELRAKLSPMDLKVLRGHERTMSALIDRWGKLRPKEVSGIATSDDARQLSAVRDSLAHELAAAVGFIERLGYRLDDHYIGVAQILSGKVTRAPVGPAPKEKATIGARFVLDRRGRPQWSKAEKGYWLQTWLNDAPDRTASVVWRMHPTIQPSQETTEAAPEFRKDFVANGDFTVRADLRTKQRAAAGSVRRGLVDALEEQYPGRRATPLQAALTHIATH
jgi:hypothetical protein